MAALPVVQAAQALRERFNRNEVRQLIQELVSFENDVASSKTPGRSIGTRQEPIRVAVTEDCTCVCVCSRMNSSLWSSLPDELLQLVFARLPLHKIDQLRTLSKKWNRRFSSSDDSEFMRACQAAHPGLFAMVIEAGPNLGCISVRLYDTKERKWFSFIDPMGRDHVFTMFAGDGGLVCTVSAAIDKEENPLWIVVSNPLTRLEIS